MASSSDGDSSRNTNVCSHWLFYLDACLAPEARLDPPLCTLTVYAKAPKELNLATSKIPSAISLRDYVTVRDKALTNKVLVCIPLTNAVSVKVLLIPYHRAQPLSHRCLEDAGATTYRSLDFLERFVPRNI
ncbi:hypothetical protein D9758_000939 [Tetrapyrgos nigripes]|uniref:Uncharacterized protein n=1 Tax=Tetrapyrgos nigripes TaxID=182062 RepID=A0A8H5GZM4_9AGAR|nr:hypothetical protein D9758_000939 [Tetrapyrgos nigripes]